jgi:hypothetical protein
MKHIPVKGGSFAAVDDDWFERLSRVKWSLAGDPKARTGMYAHSVLGYMHRIVFGALRGQRVDHIDGDKLNNRSENLRLATRAQNAVNSQKKLVKNPASRFKGVSNPIRSKGFTSTIFIDGQRNYLGTFVSEIAAANAYDQAARKHFGGFARLNFPYGIG